LGPVFRAYDQERDRLVAIKLFRVDLAPERVHQLMAEFERLVAAGLTHPTLARPVATGIVGASAYLAVEYVSAESLDLALREYGPAPAGDAMRVAVQLADALDFAAAVNISHGALHPRDVLLSSDETRLTGIGVAHALERVGIAPPVRRPYSAPERIAGGAWDRRADVFGLAALIHELLWGRRITGIGRQAADALAEIPNSDLSALRSVFARALAERPGDRHATAFEFAEALKSAFTVAPTTDQRRTTNDPRLTHDPRPTTHDHKAVQQDFDLRAAEDARYADVEVAPAVVPGSIDIDEDLADNAEPPALDSMFDSMEPARSRTWPMTLMLVAGVGLGFAVGYAYRNTGQPPAAPSTAATTRASSAPPAARGREFTESAVPDDRVRPSISSGPAVQPKPNTPPAATTPTEKVVNVGRVLVRSSPSGAAVFLDGHDAGRTPVAVRDLEPGTHRLRVVRDGYEAQERRVVITATQPAQSIIMNLEPRRGGEVRASQSSAPETIEKYTGALVVESRPAGAKVFIDNKLVGTTPLSLAGVRAGEHALRLESEGYRRWTSQVRIAAGERGRVTASLER
jgi:serine/threonine-protein kinase